MEYVELMRTVNLDLAAEYLVMAAMLAEIKSRMLLPRHEEIEEEADPRAELVRRLQEYERFKQAATDIDDAYDIIYDELKKTVENPAQLDNQTAGYTGRSRYILFCSQNNIDPEVKGRCKLFIRGVYPEELAKEPANLPWKELEVDIVLECTGLFRTSDLAGAHLSAGAKRVIISAPAKGDITTVVLGINEHILTGDEKIISNASRNWSLCDSSM